MAKATLILAPVPIIPQPKVVLELEYEEAKTLKAVTGIILGDIETSRRKYTSAVYDALSAVVTENTNKLGGKTGYITFQEEEGI